MADKLSDLQDAAKLHNFLVSIDDKLSRQQVQVSQRPIACFEDIQGKFGVAFFNCPAWLKEAVWNWYRKQYGQKVDQAIQEGFSVILIRGEPFRIRFPVVYGTVRLNLLEFIEGANAGFWQDFAADQVEMIAREIARLYYLLMDGKTSRKILADLNTAAHKLTGEYRDYGLSKWSSAQAAEKSLKTILYGPDETKWKKTHDIKRLVEEAIQCGHSDLQIRYAELVDCDPSARYNYEVTLDEAIKANHAAILIIGILSGSTRYKQYETVS
ncbi:HEPN domain-containing protein [Kordiimonas pumila]|uniref:HEPN domain-containing protein n=1 Tax=Kordiimonas pumila TaxID=2161677 RepID=A0ABV7D2P1_9PROT|nr:HEPN domain-containing protein [Kordiimonas pumila]